MIADIFYISISAAILFSSDVACAQARDFVPQGFIGFLGINSCLHVLTVCFVNL